MTMFKQLQVLRANYGNNLVTKTPQRVQGSQNMESVVNQSQSIISSVRPHQVQSIPIHQTLNTHYSQRGVFSTTNPQGNPVANGAYYQATRSSRIHQNVASFTLWKYYAGKQHVLCWKIRLQPNNWNNVQFWIILYNNH